MPNTSSAVQVTQHLRPFDSSVLEDFSFGFRTLQDLARRAVADADDSTEHLLWAIDKLAGKLAAEAQRYAEAVLVAEHAKGGSA